MTIPDKITIIRMEDYYSKFLGACADGRLFWAYETWAFSKPTEEMKGEDWQKYRKEYAVLHTFDKAGNYLNTNWVCSDTTWNTNGTSLDDQLEVLVEQLGEVEYKDIEIKLFKTDIDGFTFGLIPDEENELINLEPSSMISFQEPWDGEYFT